MNAQEARELATSTINSKVKVLLDEIYRRIETVATNGNLQTEFELTAQSKQFVPTLKTELSKHGYRVKYKESHDQRDGNYYTLYISWES